MKWIDVESEEWDRTGDFLSAFVPGILVAALLAIVISTYSLKPVGVVLAAIAGVVKMTRGVKRRQVDRVRERLRNSPRADGRPICPPNRIVRF